MEGYFESLQNEISKFRNDVILLSPSVTQLLKSSSSYEILETFSFPLEPLSFNFLNFAFFCVSGFIEKTDSLSVSSY